MGWLVGSKPTARQGHHLNHSSTSSAPACLGLDIAAPSLTLPGHSLSISHILYFTLLAAHVDPFTPTYSTPIPSTHTPPMSATAIAPPPLSPPSQSVPLPMASKTPPSAPPAATAPTTQGAPPAALTAPQPPSMPQWTEQETLGPPQARPSSRVPSAWSSASPNRASSPRMRDRSTSMPLCCLSSPQTSLQRPWEIASGRVRRIGHVWCSMMLQQGCVTMLRYCGTLLAPTAAQEPS